MFLEGAQIFISPIVSYILACYELGNLNLFNKPKYKGILAIGGITGT